MVDIRKVVNGRKKELGLSLRKLAAKCGISDSSIKRIADGKTENPKIETLRSLSKALEMPFKMFLEECGYFKEDSEYDI